MLSNGDLVLDTVANSSGDGDLYECVASFEQQNVTMARYRLVDPYGHSGTHVAKNMQLTTLYYYYFTWSGPLKIWMGIYFGVSGGQIILVCGNISEL